MNNVIESGCERRVRRLAIPLVALLVCGCTLVDERIPGDLRRFDPVATATLLLQKQAEGYQLLDIWAFFVRSDGTIDVKADYVHDLETVAFYHFLRPNQRPREASSQSGSAPRAAPPLGSRPLPDPEKTPQPAPAYELLTVRIYRPARHSYTETVNGVSSDITELRRGMALVKGTTNDARPEAVVSPPVLSFAEVWQRALDKNVPADAVAQIRYDWKGYHFEVRYTDMKLELDPSGRPADP